MAPSFQNVSLNQPNVSEQGLRRQRVGVVGSCSCQLWDVGVRCLGMNWGLAEVGKLASWLGLSSAVSSQHLGRERVLSGTC